MAYISVTGAFILTVDCFTIGCTNPALLCICLVFGYIYYVLAIKYIGSLRFSQSMKAVLCVFSLGAEAEVSRRACVVVELVDGVAGGDGRLQWNPDGLPVRQHTALAVLQT